MWMESDHAVGISSCLDAECCFGDPHLAFKIHVLMRTVERHKNVVVDKFPRVATLKEILTKSFQMSSKTIRQVAVANQAKDEAMDDVPIVLSWICTRPVKICVGFELLDMQIREHVFVLQIQCQV